MQRLRAAADRPRTRGCWTAVDPVCSGGSGTACPEDVPHCLYWTGPFSLRSGCRSEPEGRSDKSESACFLFNQIKGENQQNNQSTSNSEIFSFSSSSEWMIGGVFNLEN